MPIIRNLFKRNTAVQAADPTITEIHERTITSSDEKTSAITIQNFQLDDEKNSYKLSVVDGNGAYLPPSPPERKGFWKRTSSSNSLAHREALRVAETEGGFAISRESFESYRRSFDISARSPIVDPQRTSLDSRPSRTSLDALSPLTPTRQSFDLRTGNTRLASPAIEESESEEEEFKDVDLNDDVLTFPRKRGFLARFGGSDHSTEQDNKSRPRTSTLNWKREHHQGCEELNDFRMIVPDTRA